MFFHHKKSALYRKLDHQLHRKRRWFMFTVGGLTGLLLIAGGSYTAYVMAQAPKLSHVFNSSEPIKVTGLDIQYKDRHGKTFYRTSQSHYQAMTKQQFNQAGNIKKALVATEDRHYYHEGGVNWLHTIYSAIMFAHNNGSAASGGGSTITQQLIKLTFFSTMQKDRTVQRKIQEIKLAEELNHRYSKNQILRWYLDAANFGNGQQGIVAAAKYYYNKSPQNLTMLEAATLVGMVNAPGSYNPYLNQSATMQRRNLVLKSLYESKQLSRNHYENLTQAPVTTDLQLAKINVQQGLKDRHDKLKYNGFVSGVNAQLSRYNNQLTSHSMTVMTTMDKNLQDSVSRIVDQYHYPDDKLQEAIVVLDNHNGNVLALSGGRGAMVLGGYNRAFNARRSSGSTIKPLLDYGPAMDLFHWGTDQGISDDRFKYPGTNTVVNNWDNQYQGNMTIRKALVESRNVPAVKTLAQVGLGNGQLALNALGFNAQQLFYANAIGVDTNPLIMASAYSSLANYGRRTNAKMMTAIDNNQRQILFKDKSAQVFSPQTAFMLTDILKGVFNTGETGAKAKIDGINQAGKTGTVGRDTTNKTDALTDSWMIGYTKSYTVAVWVGYDNPNDPKTYLNTDKAQIAVDLYKQVMQAASKLPNSDNSDWSMPAGLTKTSNNYHFNDNVNTDNDFRNSKNRRYSRVPGIPNVVPSYFLNQTNNSQNQLNQVLNNVNKSNN